MSSYYREHVAFPNVAAGPYPPHIIAELERNAAARDTASTNGSPNDPHNRVCSVKGCSSQLPAGYTNKMCEECRGRHRVYAMTKRAKRKMEKALLNGSAAQNGQVVWMPQDEGIQHEHEQPVAGPSRQYESQPQDLQVTNENVQHFDFPPEWDPQAIDPRLFSQASELAGALTLPGTALQHIPGRDIFARNDHEPQQLSHQPPQHPAQQPPSSHTRSPSVPPPSPPTAPEIHPILAEVLKAVPNFNLSTRITSGPTVSPSGGTSDGPLPPRFCSVKGCKTLIAGNSFFKMCEPCRDRYRNYGTTKRAKWKREKEAAVQELHKLRSEEEARRAAEGLPPLSPAEEEHWHEYSPPTTAGPVPPTRPSSGSGTPAPADGQDPNAPLPPRMCTVSHCREILPGNYQFLRCERHRIQNRHHSKLKRVRDKEVKAQVHDDWAAAVGAHLTGGSAEDDVVEDVDVPAQDVALSANDIAQVFGELEKELRDGGLGTGFTGVVAEAGVDTTQSQQQQDEEEDTPLGEPGAGVPPAARGTRRTNHVCSIKTCSNLLSPSNPWKMCDPCRSRDRASRRLKALRDSGLIPAEVAAGKIVEVHMEVEGRDVRKKGEKEKKEKGVKKKAKKAVEGPSPATGESTSHQAEADNENVASGSGSCGGPEIVEQPADTTSCQDANVNLDISDGAINPSALQQTPPAIESQTSIFNSLPNHANLIFMEPILGELASTIQRHLAQLNGGDPSDAAMESMQTQDMPQGDETEPAPPDQALQAATDVASAPPAPPSPKKKGRKGKGKAKPISQANAEPTREQPSEAIQPVITISNVEDPSHHPPPSYPPPPPNGYPYYIPPYMPYGQPLNYQYGYHPPPAALGKGHSGYPPPPPMYQHPYGPYPPYPYPYPGQPYPYPGAPYMPPLPPGQSYSPPPQSYSPPSQAHPPPDPSQQPAGQPQQYPPQIQPYPYSHPYPPPPPPPAPPPQVPQPPPASPPEPEIPAAMYMTFPSNAKPPPEEPNPTFRAGTRMSPSPMTISATRTTTPASTDATYAATPATAASVGPPDGSDKDKSQKHANAHPGGHRRNTFIVRTSETYETPPVLYTKPTFALKRRRDEDYYDLVQNKRMEAEKSGYSVFRISLPKSSSQSGSPSPPVAQSQVAQPAVVAETSAQSKIHCGNKNCKRVLPDGVSGSLCERCRERLKKKQAKAKHRFKLEPKTFLRRSSDGATLPVEARVS